MHRGFFNPGLGLHRRAGGFLPTDIAGLYGWWDCSDESTITESSGDVSQIDDKSGNGNDLVKSTASEQPSTGTRTQNSLNVIDFTNTQSLDSGTSWLVDLPSSFSVYGVAVIDTAGGDDQDCIWQIEDSGEDGFGIKAATSGFPTEFYNYLDDNGGVGGDLGNSSADRRSARTRGYTIDDSSGARRIIASNSVIASDTNYNGAIGSIGQLTMNGLEFAGPGDFSNGIDQATMEWMIYDSVLSSADEAAVMSYLQDKWNVT